VCSTDIHYTDWMATELILIRRVSPRPDIAPLLDRMEAFLDSRIDARGVTRYEDSCAAYPGCVIPYYSIASGCGIDYDTRAWTNELGYSALLFDDARAPAYGRVMSFMRSLERGGTFADKWDFWGPTSDPYYVWTAADTSVINTSLIFWSLASVLSGRGGRTPCHELESDPGDGPAEPAALAPGGTAAPLGAILDALRPAVPRATRRATVDSLLAAGDRPLYCDAATAPSGTPDGTPVAGGTPAAPTASGLARPGALGVAIRGRPGAAVLAIRLTLPAAGPASLVVFDAGGRRVRDLDAPGPAPGVSQSGWDLRDAAGRPCASGVYFVVLRQGGSTAVARAAIVR
jgi:hypothetical protein